MKASNRKSEIKERLLRKLRERHPIKLCLVMIVKNESKNIPRLLETLKDIIDCISVVDTGSTDNTEEVMTEWAKRNGIPCKIHHEPFRDFGYNRTHSFEMAKKSFPECPYFLLSDADFIWEDNGFDKNKLCQPFYYVEQYNSVLSYWNIRIIASKYSWVCEGVTHEYWYNKDVLNYGTNRLSELRIHDLEDGGCKENKFNRDEALLKRALESKLPKRLISRYHFYLAQTYRDTKRYSEAIEYYKKRVEEKGWYEEVFCSLYMIGKCYAILRDFKSAEIYLWKAYQYNKNRSEPLFVLATIMLEQGKREEALKYIEIGEKIKFPERDILFIEKPCYETGFQQLRNLLGVAKK